MAALTTDWDDTPRHTPPELEHPHQHADPPDHSPAVRAGVRIMDRLDPDVYAEISAWLTR